MFLQKGKQGRRKEWYRRGKWKGISAETKTHGGIKKPWIFEREIKEMSCLWSENYKSWRVNINFIIDEEGSIHICVFKLQFLKSFDNIFITSPKVHFPIILTLFPYYRTFYKGRQHEGRANNTVNQLIFVDTFLVVSFLVHFVAI